MLARLDEWLDGPGEAGWVVLTGGPGMGKSAILSAWLARREATGAVVPHHFIRRQIADWDQPEVIAVSLAVQIEAAFPALCDADAKPERRLVELLGRVSKQLGGTGRMVVVVDGLDETRAEPGENPLPRFLPHAMPAGIRFLCATRPTYPYLNWLEARSLVRRLDLDEARWAASNAPLIRRVEDEAGSRWRPPELDFHPQDRPALLVEIRMRLNTYRRCILSGPVGIGKTTLAHMFATQFYPDRCSWQDLRNPSMTGIEPPPDGFLVVIVGIDESVSFPQLATWLLKSPNPVIAITARKDYTDRLVGSLGCARQADGVTCELGGLLPAESMELVRDIIPGPILRNIDAVVARICDLLHHHPIRIRFLADLIKGDDPRINEIYYPSEFDEMHFADFINTLWCEGLIANNATTFEVAEALCAASLFGVSMEGLAFLTKQTNVEVNTSIQPLVSRGLASKLRGCDIYVPHPFLRDVFRKKSTTASSSMFRTNYQHFLESQLHAESVQAKDILAICDAWISSVVATFEAIRRVDWWNPFGKIVFVYKYTHCLEQLEHLGVIRLKEAPFRDWLASRISHIVTTLRCDECIALAKLVSTLPPNPVWGIALRPGWSFQWGQERDQWAEAECIIATAHHWSSTAEMRLEALSALEHEVQHRPSFHPTLVVAFAAAFDRIGESDRADFFLAGETSRTGDAHGVRTISKLTMLGVDAASDYSLSWSKQLYEANSLVTFYLHSHGVTYRAPSINNRVGFNGAWLLFLAGAACSKPFHAWVVGIIRTTQEKGQFDSDGVTGYLTRADLEALNPCCER